MHLRAFRLGAVMVRLGEGCGDLDQHKSALIAVPCDTWLN
jgi:hypothetical protein